MHERGFFDTHLWLAYDASGVITAQDKDAERKPKHELIPDAPAPTTDGIFCLTEEFDGLLFKRIQLWGVVDYLGNKVPGRIRCTRCRDLWKNYVDWLGRGGKERHETYYKGFTKADGQHFQLRAERAARRRR